MASALDPIGLEERMRDEVASKNVEIRFEREGQSNRAFDLGFTRVRSEMHVAHHSDAKSMECFRQVPQTNADVLGDGNMRLDQETVYSSDGAYPHRPIKSLFQKASTVQELSWPRKNLVICNW